MNFERDRFIEDCITANNEQDGQASVREVLARAVSEHSTVLSNLGPPHEAKFDVLHRSPTLTILAANWAPNMNLLAHDHRMWALVGIYTGREDNIFWRRTGDGAVEPRSASVLFAGDIASLPPDVIHSVANPLPRFTAGLHIYGGDMFSTARSQWNPETLAEEPSDAAAMAAVFERENTKLRRLGEPTSSH